MDQRRYTNSSENHDPLPIACVHYANLWRYCLFTLDPNLKMRLKLTAIGYMLCKIIHHFEAHFKTCFQFQNVYSQHRTNSDKQLIF